MSDDNHESTEKQLPNPPPAPPPPVQPLPRFSIPNLDKNHSTKLPVASVKTTLHEALWAVDDPELQKACFFGRVALNHPPKEYFYHKNIPAILQNGPTCGLTAISMLLLGQISAVDLLEQAKELKFTNNGEMFSTCNLEKLLKVTLGTVGDVKLNAKLYSGKLYCDEIKEKLRQNCLLLVPYDSDVNHSPTELSGHKAHWALVVGYLIDRSDQFYVLARHGKSRNLAAWSLQRLSDSNLNLNEFKQPAEHPNEVFLLPDGGIAGELGLKGKSLIVKFC